MNQRILINQFLNIEFAGRNQSVIPSVKKPPKKEEDKYNPAAPKKVIVIRVSLVEWLKKRRIRDAQIPMMQQHMPPQ